MTDRKEKLGIGILGAASIARKNVKAIGRTTDGIGEFCGLETLCRLKVVSDRYFGCICSQPKDTVEIHAQTLLAAEVVAVGSRTLSKAEAFIKETGLEGKAKAYGRQYKFRNSFTRTSYFAAMFLAKKNS